MSTITVCVPGNILIIGACIWLLLCVLGASQALHARKYIPEWVGRECRKCQLLPKPAEAGVELYVGPNGLFRLLGWILITATRWRREDDFVSFQLANSLAAAAAATGQINCPRGGGGGGTECACSF